MPQAVEPADAEAPATQAPATNVGRWTIPDAGKVCIAIVVIELFILTFLAIDWVPAIRDAFHELAAAKLPSFTSKVISGWWFPLCYLLILGTVAASFLQKRPGQRVTVLCGAVIVGFLVIFATWWGMTMPFREIADAVESY